jgi:hypothetical protein
MGTSAFGICWRMRLRRTLRGRKSAPPVDAPDEFVLSHSHVFSRIRSEERMNSEQSHDLGTPSNSAI